jgi:serine/threonine-protein kinase/endoribonuclease IRE1
MKSLPNLESAYVGMVEESDSLFAMSPSRFPLLAFGDETQHASRGIDPSWKEEEDVPTNVDDITRARKLREYEERRARETSRCLSSEGFDARCLVGIHKLEGGTGEGAESRMRRLLDSSPTAEKEEELPTKYATPEPRETPENATLSGWPSATAYVLPFLNVESPLSFAVSAAWIAALAAVVFSIGKQRGSQAILANNSKPSSPAAAANGYVSPPIDQPVPVPVPEEAEIVTVNVSDVPPTPTPATPKLNGKAVPDDAAEAGDDSDNEDESKEDENSAAVKKKSNRRGKRGKKKKQQSGSSQEESLKTGNGAAPEPEQQSPSLIIAKAEPPVATAPSLIVSDSILGKFYLRFKYRC